MPSSHFSAYCASLVLSFVSAHLVGRVCSFQGISGHTHAPGQRQRKPSGCGEITRINPAPPVAGAGFKAFSLEKQPLHSRHFCRCHNRPSSFSLPVGPVQTEWERFDAPPRKIHLLGCLSPGTHPYRRSGARMGGENFVSLCF